LIATVNDSLDLLGVATFWQYVALGVLLVAAVGADTAFRGVRPGPEAVADSLFRHYERRVNDRPKRLMKPRLRPAPKSSGAGLLTG